MHQYQTYIHINKLYFSSLYRCLCENDVFIRLINLEELSMAANSEVLNEPREYSYSWVYDVNAHTRKLKNKNWEDWVSVWKRTVFKQIRRDGTKVRTLRLELDTDLVLADEIFDQLWDIIESPMLKRQDIPPKEFIPEHYIPQSFLNVIYNILPGECYLNEGDSTGTGYFKNNDIENLIASGIEVVTKNTSAHLKFEHEKKVGLNHNRENGYVNLDIKFFNKLSDNLNDNFERIIYNHGREEQKHPKQEIALNIHLYRRTNAQLTQHGEVINNPEQFKRNIQKRLKEFFTSFIEHSEWLDISKIPASSPPVGCSKGPIFHLYKEAGNLYGFHQQPVDSDSKGSKYVLPPRRLKTCPW